MYNHVLKGRNSLRNGSIDQTFFLQVFYNIFILFYCNHIEKIEKNRKSTIKIEKINIKFLYEILAKHL